MRRLYSNFPDAMPGVGLLLLRAAIAVRLMIYAFSIARLQGPNSGMWAPALLVFVISMAFLTGFLTRLAGILAAVAGVAIHLLHPVWDPSLAAVFSFDVIVIATAISLLGPGAFSLDARLFGRRKVIIPRVANS